MTNGRLTLGSRYDGFHRVGLMFAGVVDVTRLLNGEHHELTRTLINVVAVWRDFVLNVVFVVFIVVGRDVGPSTSELRRSPSLLMSAKVCNVFFGVTEPDCALNLAIGPERVCKPVAFGAIFAILAFLVGLSSRV